MKDDTKQVIVDARGIGSIDITAAERLVILKRNLNARGIYFYLTEHSEAVNDQLRAFGAGVLIEEGSVRRTVSQALRAAGVDEPYPLEGYVDDGKHLHSGTYEWLAEFDWAFGENAGEKVAILAKEVAKKLVDSGDFSLENIVNAENSASWGRLGLIDEDELLNRLEQYFAKLEDGEELHIDEIEERLEQRRHVIENRIKELDPEAFEALKRYRERIRGMK